MSLLYFISPPYIQFIVTFPVPLSENLSFSLKLITDGSLDERRISSLKGPDWDDDRYVATTVAAGASVEGLYTMQVYLVRWILSWI